jgi:hypothetical protein
MITLDLSILNQKGTPMFNSDIFANRPNFGIPGRIFISTDTLEIYRDTGSAWDQLGGGGGGGTISGTIAAGQVAFGTAANTIGGTNNLYWDNASTFLGINTNTPNNNLVVNTIVSDGGILLKQNNTSIGELIRVGTNNYSKLLLINAGINNIDINAGGFSYIRQNNFAIGSNTDTGQKFQVVGNSLLNGDVTFSSSTGMFWNSTNNRLGINTNNPISQLHIFNTVGQNTQLQLTSNTANAAIIGFNDSTAGIGSFLATGSSFTFGTYQSSQVNLTGGVGGVGIRTGNAANAHIRFYSGNANADFSPEIARFLSTSGNLLINTTTDTGQKLQVNGTSSFIGNATFSGYAYITGFTVTPNIGQDTGWNANFGSTSQASGGITIKNQRFESGVSPNGNVNGLQISYSFNGATSTFTNNSLLINNIINQTSGTGTTRGIHINPTLTLAADWRSIQWDNNTGWGLYGAGTAPSFFNGNVQIGSTLPIASNIKLQVQGLAHILDARNYTTGTIQSFVVQKDLTINAAISASSGICNYVSTGNNLIASSRSVPDSTSFANIYAFNKYQFNSPALTLTANQASPGVRSITQLFTQNVFKGVNSGTITHMSGVQIGGYYNDNTVTITPVITNAYQLLINDTGAYGHTFSFTNRWGIYQEGINDRNYLAGNLMLNSTTDTGQILQVTGAIRVNGQASGTAGGNSGNHLIINVDGTQYKIALLNP